MEAVLAEGRGGDRGAVPRDAEAPGPNTPAPAVEARDAALRRRWRKARLESFGRSVCQHESVMQRRRAFTLVELLVVLAIVAVAAAILLPVLASTRERAKATTCQSNLRQLGQSFVLYTADWDGLFPPVFEWKDRLQAYIRTVSVNRCPSRPNLPWWYGHIGFPPLGVRGFAGTSEPEVASPSEKILAAEWERCNAGPPVGPMRLLAGGATSYWAVCRVHIGASNVLFGDGHVRSLRPDAYHSNTVRIEADGTPVPPIGEPLRTVPEPVWRRHWDVRFDL